jgi:hypothetical protein
MWYTVGDFKLWYSERGGLSGGTLIACSILPEPKEVEMKRMYEHLTIAVLAVSLVACARTNAQPTVEPPGVSSESDLQAVLEIPARLSSGEAVPLDFTLINRSDARLYVLKWYTPLEGIAGEIFRIERDGQDIPYQGILATRGTPPAEAYVLLEPGESVSAEVDLAKSYDFSIPGKYTIEFLSPSISHVARTEGEMARTLDDLGPVQMPSNRVTVEITSAAAVPPARTLAEAEEMIREHLYSQKPDLNPDFRLPVEEVSVHEAWEQLRAQVFRVTEGPFARESFLISGDTVLALGTAVGDRGVNSLEIADLDRDGSAELLFTYSFGSGIHQSRIGMYAPAHSRNRVYEAATGYLGDLGLLKEDTSTVGVRVVYLDDASLTLRYGERLGVLAIMKQLSGQVKLVLQVAEGLPDDVRENLIQTSALLEPSSGTSSVAHARYS